MPDPAPLPDQGRPDPTVLTTEALQREVTTLEDRDTRLAEDLRREIGSVQRELEVRQETRQREHATLEQLVETKISVLNERLRGIDRASELLKETVNRTPTEVTKEINHLKSVMDERFHSTDTQFKERDTRSEREARDNKLAVDAAFAAQEKQAVAQNEGNNLAISKSETATAETIKTNQELSKSEINSLRKSHEDQKVRQSEVDDDLKKRLGSIEASFATLASSTRVGALEAQLVGIASAQQGAADTRVDSRAGSTLVLTVVGTFLLALSIGISLAMVFRK